MSQTIWKFRLPLTGIDPIDMPEGAEILSVLTQGGYVQLWAIVDPAAPMQKRYFEIVGTGQPLPHMQSRKYIGTVQLLDGHIVFHVFEMIKL